MKEYLMSKKVNLSIKSRALKEKLKEKDGDGYIDTGVKILIGVVVGALLLAGLYKIFGDTVLPTLEQRIKDMFDYKG